MIEKLGPAIDEGDLDAIDAAFSQSRPILKTKKATLCRVAFLENICLSGSKLTKLCKS